METLLAILATLKAFFQSNSDVAKVVEKAEPSQEERDKRLEIDKPRMVVEERLAIEDKIFNKIKNNPQANVEGEVKWNTDCNEEDTQLLIGNIKNKLDNYRRRYPLLSGWWKHNH